MGGRLLVARVHELDPFLHATGVDGRDVEPGEGEDRADAFLRQHPRDELAAADRGHAFLASSGGCPPARRASPAFLRNRDRLTGSSESAGKLLSGWTLARRV